jgi:hypothetical protein
MRSLLTYNFKTSGIKPTGRRLKNTSIDYKSGSQKRLKQENGIWLKGYNI